MQTKALFVLVWDWENEQDPFHQHDDKAYKNEKLLYWLEYAKAFGQGSPILVLQNKIDRDDKRLLPNVETSLKANYPIIDFIPLSAKMGKGFSIFENSINQAFQDNETLQKAFVQELPMSWIETRRAIRELQQKGVKEIDKAHFATICSECKAGETSSETILSFLHQVGVLYYREGYFSNRIIVNQAWAIDAVYQILDRSSHYYEILEHQQGKLVYQYLCKIWKDNENKERELFIDFMLSCELCFETTENKEWNTPLTERTFVVPQLLPNDKPSEIDFLSEEVYHLTQQTEVLYAFLPQVFMQRFIVKANKLATVETMWQQGILLNYNDAYALVEVDYEQKIIRITSNANAHNFVKDIKIVLENIANEGKMNFKQEDNALKIMALWEKYLKPTTKMTKSEIQNLIAQNRIKEAITALSKVLPAHEQSNIILLQGQWSGLERDKNMGILTNSEYSVPRNTIIMSLLSLCDNIETTPNITINKTINVTPGFKGTISNVIDTRDVSSMVTVVKEETPIKPTFLMTFAANDLSGISTEVQKISEIVSKSVSINAQQLENVDIDTLADVILDAQNLTFFHFGGHADQGNIVLDGFRNLDKIRLSRILLPMDKHSVQLIFLNGCLSYGHVGILTAKGVKAIIATNVEVNDSEAARLAAAFYKAFIEKDFTLQSAFEHAEARVKGNNSYPIIVNPGEIDEHQAMPSSWTLFIHAQYKEVLDWTLGDFVKELS